MRPPTILTRSSEAFNQLAAGGIEDVTGRAALFEEIAQDFEQLKTWWMTETKSVSADYTATDIDHTIRVDATGAPRTINLPPAASVVGMQLTVKKTDGTANAITVDANAAELIDGALTWSTTNQNSSATIQSNGVGWDVLYSTFVPTAPTWASITGKPTTIGGYGITDFNSLGDARWLGIGATAVNSSLLQGFASSDVAGINTIVRRTASGYIFSNYINTTDDAVSGLGLLVGKGGGGDNYHRSYSAATVKTFLNLAGTNTGDQTTITGNAGTATTLQTARTIWSQSFNGSANVAGNLYINLPNAGDGLVGQYNPDLHQAVFAMGDAYKLTTGGGLSNFYGISWSYDFTGRQLNTGYLLQHCLVVANAGGVKSVLGIGLYTVGVIRTDANLSVGTSAAIGGSLQVGGGASVAKWLTATFVWDPPNIAASSFATTSVTVTGAAVGDIALTDNAWEGDGIMLQMAARVSAANNVNVVIRNTDPTGSYNPISRTGRVWVIKF